MCIRDRSFRYGQRHVFELEAAARVAASIGVADHRTAAIDLRVFGGSALTSDIEVPKGRTADEMSHGIPVTYVPARNTIFLSFALAWAEVLGASDIFIGVNALDYSCLLYTSDVYKRQIFLSPISSLHRTPAGITITN